MVTDTCQERGFSLAKVNPETNIKLQEVGPPWKVAPNPFDIGVSGQFHPMEVYHAFFEAMTDDTTYYILLVNDSRTISHLFHLHIGGQPTSP